MGKHLDKVIDLEYKHVINNSRKKLSPNQAIIFKQGLRDDLKKEIKEEILDDVTKDVEKSFETRYEEEKVKNIETLTIVGIVLSFFVGLAVNQFTECLSLFKYLFPKYKLALPVIFFLAFSCLVLVILLYFILHFIRNTFSKNVIKIP